MLVFRLRPFVRFLVGMLKIFVWIAAVVPFHVMAVPNLGAIDKSSGLHYEDHVLFSKRMSAVSATRRQPTEYILKHAPGNFGVASRYKRFFGATSAERTAFCGASPDCGFICGRLYAVPRAPACWTSSCSFPVWWWSLGNRIDATLLLRGNTGLASPGLTSWPWKPPTPVSQVRVIFMEAS